MRFSFLAQFGVVSTCLGFVLACSNSNPQPQPGGTGGASTTTGGASTTGGVPPATGGRGGGGGAAGGSSSRTGVATFVDGGLKGTVKFLELDGGDVHVTAELTGFTAAGEQAFHVHENGMCSPEDDHTKAGGHWNPSAAQHACPPDPRHAGDLGSLTIDQAGKGTASVHIVGSEFKVKFDDFIGKAVIIHANKDDCKTQSPAGNSGKRVGCAVIELKK